MKTTKKIPKQYALVLGYFSDQDVAKAAFDKLVKEEKFRRVAIAHRNSDGSLDVRNHHSSQRRKKFAAVGAGAAMGAAASRLMYPLIPFGMPAKLALTGAATLGGARVGYGISKHVIARIHPDLVQRYAQWVVRGETMVMALTMPASIARVRRALLSDPDDLPAIFVRRTLVAPPLEEGPFSLSERREAASPEQMQIYAERLAKKHQKIEKPPISQHLLLSRLRDNQRIISALHEQLNIAAHTGGAPSLSAEWLLDNNYIIQGQIEDVKRNLGRHFFDELPRNNEGIPRLYDIAVSLIHHTDGRIDRENITAFVRQYQEILPLKIGELWALPQVLRLAIIEHQRNLFIATAQRQRDRERADFWANRLLNAAHRDPDRLHLVLGSLAEEQRELPPHFIDRLVSHLYGEDVALQPVQAWLERRTNAPLIDISNTERKRHAADQVAIANTVSSQRTLGQMDWNEVFEELSLVHENLQRDPADVYSKMDFKTRNEYRLQVEKIAKHGGESEVEVSKRAIQFARSVGLRPENPLSEHVGYYLLDDGRPQLEASCAYTPPLITRTRRFIQQNALPLYLGIGGAITAATAVKVLLWGGKRNPWLGLLSILPASTIALELVNFLTARIFEPAHLPRLNFENGIPEDCKTLVVIPMMLSSEKDVRSAAEMLEIRYLGNIDPQLKFALLADYTDARTEHTPEDKHLREMAEHCIKELNARYLNASFFLFFRERRWTESESQWMGWERKRGKLEELNAWLLGERSDDPARLHPICGNEEDLENIRYVLTLDADTQLPPDSARELVATIAHPLNQVREIDKNGVVTRGYSIISPRISVSLPSANTNHFTQLFADGAGTDPYTMAVSDIYQDLFGESSFQGKGIYDLKVFHQLLSERFPDGTILSHDLLEGAYVRTGFASEIELFDDFPPSYLAQTRRLHRWIRGDWQISDWASPRVPDKDGKLVPNPLSGLNRWKITDNLRRSLVKPALLGLFIAGWRKSVALSGALGIGCLFIPAGIQLLSFTIPPYENWHEKFAGLRDSMLRQIVEAAFLPYDVTVALDAIFKVAERRLFSHRGLLEWQTAQSVARGAKGQKKQLMQRLAIGSVLSAAGAFALNLAIPAALPVAAPFLCLWGVAPLILHGLHKTTPPEFEKPLTNEDQIYLRGVARRTWRYFDDFVGPQTNWLPPDNYQETPRAEIAQRTSPTNIGLWLLAVLSAHDFGYIPLDDATGRILETLRVTDEMEKYDGHLLNWYNIGTLEPLRPRYVSTVDSGNLLGALTALENGIRESQQRELVGDFALRGAMDTLHAQQETLYLPENQWGRELGSLLSRLKVLLETGNEECSAAEVLKRLKQAAPLAEAFSAHVQRRDTPTHQQSENIIKNATVSTPEDAQSSGRIDDLDPRQEVQELSYWAAVLEQQLQGWTHSCDRYLKWLDNLATTPEKFFMPLGQEALAARSRLMESAPSLSALAHDELPDVKVLLRGLESSSLAQPLHDWLKEFKKELGRAQWLAGEMLSDSHELLDRTRKLSDQMDLKPLYDPALKLFTIGFNVDESRQDTSAYDLLSSECRITSLMAIARDDVPVEHWWALGRRFAKVYRNTVMLSWSGTMFEYLMPLLLHEQQPHTLLTQACLAAVRTQMQYAKRRNIPWGISEAAFSDLDANSIYQYKAFGVPSLGLQRGHENDMVVAPYASMLALQVLPKQAIKNLKALQEIGAYGVYGFYDSIDFARKRLDDAPRREQWGAVSKPFQRGERGTIVRTFMVHHQGMGLLAISNLLLHGANGRGIMQERFHADPRVQSITPLLHERVPSNPALLSKHRKEQLVSRQAAAGEVIEPASDRFRTPDTPAPRAHLLSNGHHHLMVTNAGGGYSRWNDFDITRWRTDTTTDSAGTFFYIRDLDSHVTWSPTHHPLRRAARYQNVSFKSDKVEFRRRDADIETQMDVFVSPEDDVEIRLITLTNRSAHPRKLEITSYQELSLAPHAADRAHPAFAKLFVQTEAVQDDGDCTLLAWKRLREPSEKPIYAAHFFTAGRQTETMPVVLQNSTFDTSREHFLGRGGSPHRPEALEMGLTETVGAVLDPVFSMQQRWTLSPGTHLQLAVITAVGKSREKVLLLRDKYRDFANVERAADMAWTHAQLEMHHLRIQPEEAQLYQQLAGGMLYPQAHYRTSSAQLKKCSLGQPGLWSLGISGDLPIIVATLTNERDIGTLRQVVMAHTFWTLRGLKTDLVILNRQSEGYQQALSEKIQQLVNPHTGYTPLNEPGGIFMRSETQLDKEHLDLLLSAAHVVIVSARGSLAQQLSASPTEPPTSARLVISHRPKKTKPEPLVPIKLYSFNGFGGFTPDGREFVIRLNADETTPAPWVNVMANPNFGQMVSETGHNYVWHKNSQSNRLTAWSNDPVMDPISDLIYIRDNETGAYWSPTPGPLRGEQSYRARHGQGYTIWEHNSHDIESELLTFVPLEVVPDDKSTFAVESFHEDAPPIRIQRLKIKNVSSHRRQFVITSYHEWVLGENHETTTLHVHTEWDNSNKILLARNPYHTSYGSEIAFSSSEPPARNFTSDRTLFIGRNQSLRRPTAMNRRYLSDRVGAGMDSCAALQIPIVLEPDEEETLYFFMGQSDDEEKIRQLIAQFREPGAVEEALAKTQQSWDFMLGTVQVNTPITSINFLLNRWLLYQNLSCRFWGRSAFYQSGGAFGFRDQLQDTMALIYMRPDLARRQLLRAASHQFEEGDVQHWWHEEAGAGVRTRISDDLLWLPYVTMHYINITGDEKVLLEEEFFLHAPPLKDDENEKYFSPEISPEKATLYEHCIRAIEKGATIGENGLPLIGTGDWNDGLNAVGEGGKGESVWLGWFLVDILRRFAEVCEKQNDAKRAADYRRRADDYVKSIEKNAWDGEWYRRAYYDDGTPIGSAECDEDKIDVLPQSWAVLSGGGNEERTAQSLQSAEKYLVKHDDKMVLLFTPAFDKSEKNPGYIKGYLPGVRENGGQYTHGALWLAFAYAMQGNGDKAVEILQLLNPTEHARDDDGAHKYKVEPYVVAADVYNLEGQVGRGGWTWYTGSAGWMYRTWIEGVLGFHPRGDKLYIEPNIPSDWDQFDITWRYKSTFYKIHVFNINEKDGKARMLTLDGEELKEGFIPLIDDGETHNIKVLL